MNQIKSNYYLGTVSRSPSKSRDGSGTRQDTEVYSRSLPRSQLNLKPKRGSGVWSKPPTPGPYCSPGTSDSELGFNK